jgi:Arc/MetJ family transcription regulator
MSRIMIDVNYEMLAAAARIFGTTTKASTVNAAVEDAVKRRSSEGLFASFDEGIPANNHADPMDLKPASDGLLAK